MLDFYGGLTRSSDVYYYYLAGGYDQDDEHFEGLGVARVAAYARAFGFGTPTGVDLPGESSGLVPDAEWKEEVIGEPWVLGDSYNMGIGQGYLEVTPLQMAVATAALANGGDLLVPRIAHGLRTAAGTVPFEREVAATLPIESEHLEVVREALGRAADRGGTAWRGEPLGIEIGGKTGTAEFGRRNADGAARLARLVYRLRALRRPGGRDRRLPRVRRRRDARRAGRPRDPHGLLRDGHQSGEEWYWSQSTVGSVQP